MIRKKLLLSMTAMAASCMLFSVAAPAGQVSAEESKVQAAAAAQTETTQVDSAKTEETKTDASKAEETKTDAAKSEETKTDAAKSEETKTEETKTDAAKSEETKTDAAKSEETKTEETKTDAAKTEETKADASQTDAVKTEETKADASQTDTAKAEETKTGTDQTDAAKTEETKTDAAKTEETKTDASQKDAAKTEAAADAQNTENKSAGPNTALQDDPNHAHKFEWIAIMNEFEAAEGTMNYICPECGKVWFFRPIPAYLAFTGSTANKILTASSGSTVKITTAHFISVNKEVMEALAKRPDVSLYVSFLDQEYKGNRVSFTIPAGEDTMSLLDANGYAGFLYLGGKYGLTLEVPAETEDTAETAVKDEAAAQAPKEAGAEAKEEAEKAAVTEAAADAGSTTENAENPAKTNATEETAPIVLDI